MRYAQTVIKALPTRLAGLAGLALLLVFWAKAPQPTELAAHDSTPEELLKDVLDRVPSEAGIFAHANGNSILNSKLYKDIVQASGKSGANGLAVAEKYLGISVENVDSVTFYFPVMPAGPGDEKTFVVAVVTKKPYDKSKLLSEKRKKKAEVKDNSIELEEDFVLHFTNENTFAVMHKSLVANYSKGPIKDRKSGTMSSALKLATEKHTFVGAMNLPTLPNELFTAAPPELQPFLPLLKAKSATLVADLDKALRLEARFACETPNTATDAERSMNLLMKLAEDGLASVLKDKKTIKEIEPILPALKELEKGLQGIKVTKEASEMKAVMTLNIDLPIGQMVKSMIEKVEESSARAQAQNNLKQIALAMHNYADANNGFPPAAICDKKGKPLLSWRVAILPYIEQGNVYNMFKLDEPWDSEHNIKASKLAIKTYMIPGVTKPGETNYRVFYGKGAGFDRFQQIRLLDITDGTSNTLMVVEAAEAVSWAKPDDLEFDPEKEVKKLILWQNDKTNIAMFDGSVRSVSKKMSEKTWKLLIQKADGEVIGTDFE